MTDPRVDAVLALDVAELRAQYLGLFAFHLSMPPDVVDRQLVDDFYALAVWLDGHQQAQQSGGE